MMGGELFVYVFFFFFVCMKITKTTHTFNNSFILLSIYLLFCSILSHRGLFCFFVVLVVVIFISIFFAWFVNLFFVLYRIVIYEIIYF